jgi:predicted RecA/RadA family phage recombinase
MSISAPHIRSKEWDSFEVTLTGTITAGLLEKIQDTVGMYYKAGVSGAVVNFVYRAKKALVDKVTTDTLAAGQKVYYNDYVNKVSSNSSGNTLCGICVEAAGNTATTVLIDLDGAPKS